MSQIRQNEREIRELEERVDELERIIERELGYSFGPSAPETQTVDCDCDETFEVNLENGAQCPECGEVHS